jgi:hypothetical protein
MYLDIWIFMGNNLKVELKDVEEWDEGHIDS